MVLAAEALGQQSLISVSLGAVGWSLAHSCAAVGALILFLSISLQNHGSERAILVAGSGVNPADQYWGFWPQLLTLVAVRV